LAASYSAFSDKSDLSENAEYDAAKDEQRDIETQITELEAILSNAEIIQDNDKSTDRVKMESVVKLHDIEYDEDIEYVIVGSSEADSLNNKISNESPLGAALIGKKVGEIVKVEAPAGEIEYKIVEIINE
jgi:transcription elongation factor GreA